MSSRRIVVALGVLLAVAYLGFVQVRAMDREPPLVVLWSAGVVDTTVKHPRTGLAAWGVRADVEALVGRVVEARGWRTTERLDADAKALSVRVVEVKGHRVALAEVPADALATLPAKLAEVGDVALVVVASTAVPERVLATVPGPLAVLPGAYGAGVPDGGEATGTSRVVAPWIDGRRRVGVLDVRFDQRSDGGLALKGTAVDLPLREVPPDTPTLLGEGDPALHHDTVHFGNSGLGRALLDGILDATGADVALVNYLALRAGLHGPVDLLGLEKALPFHNEVVLQTFDSAQLARILETGAREDTRNLLVGSREPLPSPLPARDWRVATIDYLANGGRGGWGVFLDGRDRIRTRIALDDLAIALLKPVVGGAGPSVVPSGQRSGADLPVAGGPTASQGEPSVGVAPAIGPAPGASADESTAGASSPSPSPAAP